MQMKEFDAWLAITTGDKARPVDLACAAWIKAWAEDKRFAESKLAEHDRKVGDVVYVSQAFNPLTET